MPRLRLPALLTGLLLPLLPLHATQRPNLVLIIADDLGYGDVSCYRDGTSDVQTPHLDRLAREGMRFTHMRANATVCSPTRAAILTGRYPDRAGVPGVIRTHASNSWGWLAPEAPTLAEHLRRAGYATALVGKWHLGFEPPNTPERRGFEHFHGFLGDMMDSYVTHRRHGKNYMRLNATEIDPPGHATDLFTTWSAEYIRDRAADGRPFFLMLAYNAPHFPIEPPAAWLDHVQRRDPTLDPRRAANVALVEHLDSGIGQVLDVLRTSGLADNTLIVVTSDNGGSLPHAQSNAPWRGGKQDHYDGGLRVPFLVTWPGVVAPASVSGYAGLTFDVFATFLEAASIEPPDGSDAVSLLPLLHGHTPPNEERELYFVRREGGTLYGGGSYHALVRGRWKLTQNSPYAPLELFDLSADPFERIDLAPSEAEVVRELQRAMQRHIQRGGSVAWQPPESFSAPGNGTH